MISRLLRWLLRDWWKPVTDGKTWGIYHPTKRHVWRYGLTKEDARRECRRRNGKWKYEYCEQCGYTYAAHKTGLRGGIECP